MNCGSDSYDPLTSLANRWREDADVLRRCGHVRTADLCNQHAEEMEDAVRAYQTEELTAAGDDVAPEDGGLPDSRLAFGSHLYQNGTDGGQGRGATGVAARDAGQHPRVGASVRSDACGPAPRPRRPYAALGRGRTANHRRPARMERELDRVCGSAGGSRR